jgi:hypothetical protein
VKLSKDCEEIVPESRELHTCPVCSLRTLAAGLWEFSINFDLEVVGKLQDAAKAQSHQKKGHQAQLLILQGKAGGPGR